MAEQIPGPNGGEVSVTFGSFMDAVGKVAGAAVIVLGLTGWANLFSASDKEANPAEPSRAAVEMTRNAVPDRAGIDAGKSVHVAKPWNAPANRKKEVPRSYTEVSATLPDNRHGVREVINAARNGRQNGARNGMHNGNDIHTYNRRMMPANKV